MIRLMIAEDHAIVRAGLKHLFKLFDDIQVVAEATNGPTTLECLRQHEVDLLLLDVTMPGISGEELIVRLRGHYPELPILVLSMHNEPQVARRVLTAGANGYLTKDRDPETLIGAIRKVASGGRFLDPQLAEQMAFETTAPTAPPSHDCLTARELQIMRLIATGIGVTQIASQLAISTKTVSTHKARLMEKMGFATVADLMRYVIVHSLVD
jgi:DNA-binding NarL/FixJ family response regulator